MASILSPTGWPEHIVDPLEMVDVEQDERRILQADGAVVDGGQPVISATVGKARQRIGIGDALVFIQLQTHLLHFLGMAVDVVERLFAIDDFRAGGLGQQRDRIFRILVLDTVLSSMRWRVSPRILL